MTASEDVRVLVVDDSAVIRSVICDGIGATPGMRVVGSAVGVPSAIEASDGNEATTLFEPGKFDLVLTDWNLPGKTGLDVVKEIRGRDASVPIIIITTEAEKSRVVEAVQAGVSGYLVKPFTPETLKAKLEKHGCD
ncbi:MAG TPA: response regulator [Thermoguttaceae bacterium]|nr:response regulator [Thermoguttaceae bacterium]